MTECVYSRPGEKGVGAALKVPLMSAGGGRRDIPAGGVSEWKLASGVCLEHSGRTCLAGVQSGFVSIT